MLLFKPGIIYIEWDFPLFCFWCIRMEMNDLEARVTGLIKPVLDDIGIELYCIQIPGVKARGLLRVFIEKEGGVTINDCQRVSREIEAILDVEDPMPGHFTLEVSSPGLDRPLNRPEDFKRFTGQTARVVTMKTVENQKFFTGKILEAGEDEIIMLLPKDRQVVIAYKIISKARLEVNV